MCEINNNKMWHSLLNFKPTDEQRRQILGVKLRGGDTTAMIINMMLRNALSDQGLKTVSENGHFVIKKKPVLEIEHGKWYICIKDFFSGGVKRASRGEAVQAKRGMSMMGLENPEEYFKVWTIKDAVDGMFLACDVYPDKSPLLIIFQKYDESMWGDGVYSYCHIKAVDGDFKACRIRHSPDGWRPATEEEIDCFYNTIGQAGYEWNASTKDLCYVRDAAVGTSSCDARIDCVDTTQEVCTSEEEQQEETIIEENKSSNPFELAVYNLLNEYAPDTRSEWSMLVGDYANNILDKAHEIFEPEIEQGYKNSDEVQYQNGYDKGYEDGKKSISELSQGTISEMVRKYADYTGDLPYKRLSDIYMDGITDCLEEIFGKND